MPFFPRDKVFWIVNVLAWIFTLDRIGFAGNSLNRLIQEGKPLLFWFSLSFIWLAYIVVGILAVLLFRHWYYRRQWGEKRLIASLALALLIAVVAGMTLSFLVQLPVDAIIDNPFEIFEEAGTLLISGAFSYALYRAISLTVLFFLWLLAYWGISATLNARKLSFRALELENSLKDAKLNALSSQINPHFLFNALNNIRFMIHKDAKRAEDSLLALSEILRHSLETSRNEKVPIAEELAITEQYLSLMKNQMRDRLEYSINSTQDSDNCLAPPMIIQMLAENAIKHGVEQIKEGGRVDIHCSLVAHKLRIEVKNTAPPADSEADKTLRKLQAPIEQEDAAKRGVGLANISNRLTLLYGDRAELSMYRQGDEFLVIMELPKEQNG